MIISDVFRSLEYYFELELMIYVRTTVPKPNINMDLLDSKIERRATNYIITSGEIVQISMAGSNLV